MQIKEKRLRKGGLVLERNLQESITIFDKLDGTVQPIVITLVRLRGQRASLHVNATTNFGIVRTELLKGKTDVSTDTATDATLGLGGNCEGAGNETV